MSMHVCVFVATGGWPLFGADLLRDHRLVLPLTTPPSSTCAVQASSAPENTMSAVAAVRAAGTVDAGGFSIESLLSNVQGLLKAVVDGARHREHQAEIERGSAILMSDCVHHHHHHHRVYCIKNNINHFPDTH